MLDGLRTTSGMGLGCATTRMEVYMKGSGSVTNDTAMAF